MDSDFTKLLLMAGAAYVLYEFLQPHPLLGVNDMGMGDSGIMTSMPVSMPTGNPGLVSMNQLPPALTPTPTPTTSGSLYGDPFPHYSYGGGGDGYAAIQLQQQSAQYHVDPATAAVQAAAMPPAPTTLGPQYAANAWQAANCGAYYYITGALKEGVTPPPGC